jgi:hypothetical protein
METILKLKKYIACTALVAVAAGLSGCYVAPARYYGPRPYAYAAPGPAYGYYHYSGRPYGYGNGYYRDGRW